MTLLGERGDMAKHKTDNTMRIDPHEGWQTSRGERLSYGLFFAGQNFFYMIVVTFGALFLMNKGMDEVTVASVLIIPKVLDAVVDPAFGIIVDKARFKSGRFMPWLRIGWVAVPVFTILFFCMPGSLSQGGQIAWAFIFYMLWSLAYTVCDAPVFALSTSMSPIVQERTSILSFGRMCATIAVVIGTLSVESVYMTIGWTKLAIILAVVSMLLMLPLLLIGKERSNAGNEKPASVKDMLKVVARNRYLMIFLVSYFIIGITLSVQFLIPIFAQYVLGSTEKGTILLAICVIPIVAMAVIVPIVSKKVDKLWLFIGSLAIFAATSILQYFTDYNNDVILYITTFLRAIGFGGYNIILFLFMPNIMEYGHYKTGERQEGIHFALQTFMTKIVAAIVSSLSLVILGWFGFASQDADKATGVVSAEAGHGFWIVFTLISAIGSIIAIPILFKYYTLRDKDVQFMSMYNNGEISREECEKHLSRQY